MQRMNDYKGKEFLATVRSGDYAHAGEQEAIELVFRHVPKNLSKLILDLGCGRGGTASYIQENGWGTVVGVDVDSASIEYARSTYPALTFETCDAAALDRMFAAQFDVICLFNVFYAVEERASAVASMRKVSKVGAVLLLFDYVAYEPERFPETVLSLCPPTPSECRSLLVQHGWNLDAEEDLDQEYIRWYRDFLQRFSRPELSAAYEPEVIDAVMKKYDSLLLAHETKALGGRLFIAKAI